MAKSENVTRRTYLSSPRKRSEIEALERRLGACAEIVTCTWGEAAQHPGGALDVSIDAAPAAGPVRGRVVAADGFEAGRLPWRLGDGEDRTLASGETDDRGAFTIDAPIAAGTTVSIRVSPCRARRAAEILAPDWAALSVRFELRKAAGFATRGVGPAAPRRWPFSDWAMLEKIVKELRDRIPLLLDTRDRPDPSAPQAEQDAYKAAQEEYEEAYRVLTSTGKVRSQERAPAVERLLSKLGRLEKVRHPTAHAPSLDVLCRAVIEPLFARQRYEDAIKRWRKSQRKKSLKAPPSEPERPDVPAAIDGLFKVLQKCASNNRIDIGTLFADLFSAIVVRAEGWLLDGNPNGDWLGYILTEFKPTRARGEARFHPSTTLLKHVKDCTRPRPNETIVALRTKAKCRGLKDPTPKTLREIADEMERDPQVSAHNAMLRIIQRSHQASVRDHEEILAQERVLSPLERVCRRYDQARVLDALAELPKEEHYQVLVRKYIVKDTHAQIAQKLGIKENRVRPLCQEALEALLGIL